MLLLLMSLALAQTEEPEPEEVKPAFEVGEIEFFAVKDATSPDLTFDTCAALAPSTPLSARTGIEDGQVRLQLTFRKGKVSLVTVTETQPSLDWVTPCLKRELAAVEWDIKKGRAEVPVTVSMETQP